MKDIVDCPVSLPLPDFAKEPQSFGVKYVSWKGPTKHHVTAASCHSAMGTVGALDPKVDLPLQHITFLPYATTHGYDCLPWYKFLEDIPTFKKLKSKSTLLYSDKDRVAGIYFDDIRKDNHPLLQSKLVAHRMAWEHPFGCEAVMDLASRYPKEHRGFFLRFLYSIQLKQGIWGVFPLMCHQFFASTDVSDAIGTGDVAASDNRTVEAGSGYYGVDDLYRNKKKTKLNTAPIYMKFKQLSMFANNRESVCPVDVRNQVEQQYQIFLAETKGDTRV